MLAGGRSSRMGRDKALLPFRGGALAESVAGAVREAAGSAILVGQSRLVRSIGLPRDPRPVPRRRAARRHPHRAGLLRRRLEPGGGLRHAGARRRFSPRPAGPRRTRATPTPCSPPDLRAASSRSVRRLPPRAPAPPCEARLRRAASARSRPPSRVRTRRLLRRAGSSLVFKMLTPPRIGPPMQTVIPTRTTSSSATSIRRSTSPVLVDSNFHVDPGETVAIIGRSGVGKSVTLSHIMGFLKPDSGRVIVAHEDITDFAEAELRRIRRKVTMVFQSGALFDSLTVGENVLFSLELREDYNEQNKEDVVNGLLEMVDIAGGQRRLSRRSFHRLQARRRHRPRPGRAAAVHPLRRAHHHGRPHHVRPPRRPHAAPEEAVEADLRGGDARSRPDVQGGRPRGVPVSTAA